MTTNLCGRCANRIRERNLIRKTSQGVLRYGECDNCKLHIFVATYEIVPKRKED